MADGDRVPGPAPAEVDARARSGEPTSGQSNEMPGAATRYGLLYSLTYRNFRLLWLGQASHASALWMEQIARPWLVLIMTGDNAAHVGGVVAMRTLPMLFLGVWAGVIADRFDRRTVLISTKVGVFILSIVFAAILVSGRMELWMVYAAAFLRGSFMAFDQPARQSLIASIVPSHALTNAVALMSSTQNVMRLVGVMGSGLVIATLGIEGAFIAIAVIYIGAVVSSWMLDVPSHLLDRKNEEPTTMFQSLVEGIKYAATQPAILGVLAMSLFFFSFGMSWMQVFASLFARTVFETEAVGFSALVAISSLGAIAGTLLIASRYPKRLGLILPGSAVLMGGVLALFSAASYLPGTPGIVIPFLLVPLVGLAQTAYHSLSNALLLSATPVELRGRVISLLSLDRAMMSAGAAAGGFLAAAAGVQIAQITYGLLLVLTGVIVLFAAPGLRKFRLE